MLRTVFLYEIEALKKNSKYGPSVEFLRDTMDWFRMPIIIKSFYINNKVKEKTINNREYDENIALKNGKYEN